MYTLILIIVGLCADQILPAVNYAFPQKNSIKLFCTCALFGTYPYPMSITEFTFFFLKLSQPNKIVLKQVEENANTK